MTNRATKHRQRLKTFSVAYNLEQGFFINVKARSAAAAERSVRQWLDDNYDEFPGSERVHYDGGITGVDEVQS